MSLMIDVVINHLVANQTSDSVNYGLFPAPFNSANSYHSPCGIDYANQSSIEDCWIVPSPPPVLLDIKSENATVMNAMINSVASIVKEYNVDGIRLDTARHVPKQYLSQFQDAVGVFVTGEALNQSAVYASQYQGPLDSVINYPLWYVLTDTFMGRTTFDYLAAQMRAQNVIFCDANSLTNFLDNHDQPRLASRVGDDVERDQNAVTFLMFTTGIPIVYYGFEQRFNGSGDPVNREPMWTSGYNSSATLYKHIANLHRIRATASNLVGKSAYFASRANVLGTSAQYMAFERGPLVVVVSNVGGNGTGEAFHVSSSKFSAGATITDLLSNTNMTVGYGGSFNSSSSQGQSRVSRTALHNKAPSTNLYRF